MDINTFKRRPMTKILPLVISTIMLCAPVQASNNGEMCNYEMSYDLKISSNSITFENDSGRKILIDEDNQLFLNGTKKELNTAQQNLVDNYADTVRLLIPEVKALAIEGIDLGVSAAGMALSMLLGESDPDFSRFSTKISEVAEMITSKINATDFNSKELEEAFDEDFEKEIEAVVEEAVEELTPRMIAKVMTAAMSGNDGEISDLEARAESLELEIETYIEPRAEALEARAEELCGTVDELDKIEDRMVESGLEMMDIIEKDSANRNGRSRGHKFDFDFGD